MDRRSAIGLVAAGLTQPVVHATEPKPPQRPILVIAAAARTAPEILSQALAQGRGVTALARHPERIAVRSPPLRIVTGDVFDIDSLAAAMTGSETVISLIGPKLDLQHEPGYVDLYSVGIATLIAAMQRRGNRRLLAVSSGGTEQIPAARPTNGDRIDEFVWFERNVYGDLQRMERIIAVSGLDWIVLRPRGFVDGPRRDNLKLAVHQRPVEFDRYRAPETRTPGNGSRLTYADFASLVLRMVDDDRYLGTSVGVYTDVYPG